MDAIVPCFEFELKLYSCDSVLLADIVAPIQRKDKSKVLLMIDDIIGRANDINIDSLLYSEYTRLCMEAGMKQDSILSDLYLSIASVYQYNLKLKSSLDKYLKSKEGRMALQEDFLSYYMDITEPEMWFHDTKVIFSYGFRGKLEALSDNFATLFSGDNKDLEPIPKKAFFADGYESDGGVISSLLAEKLLLDLNGSTLAKSEEYQYQLLYFDKLLNAAKAEKGSLVAKW